MKKALKNRKMIILSVAVLVLVAVFIVLYFLVFRESRDEDGFIRKSVSKAVDEAPDVIGNTYENFTLPDSIDITCGDTLYDMVTVKHGDRDYEKLTKDVAKVFVDDFDESKLVATSEQPGLVRLSLYDDRYYFGIYSCGSINYVDTSHVVNDKLEKVYIIGKDSIDNVSYSVGGQDYSLQQAIDYVTDKFMKDFAPLHECCDGIVPYGIYVFDSGDGNYFYEVVCEIMYEGCLFMVDGESIDNRPHVWGVKAEFGIFKPDVIDSMTLNGLSVTKKEKVKEIITLETALEHLEKELAPESNYQISEVALKYVRKRDSMYVEESTIKPYWCLTVAEGGSKFGFYSPRCVIYIDAQTGDISCYDSRTMEFLF